MDRIFLKLVLIFMLLSSTYEKQNSKTFSKRPRVRTSGGIVFVDSRDGECRHGTSCVSLDKCSVAFTGKRKQFPPICDWDGNSPLVCCSLNKSTILNKFPQEDCAKHEFSKVAAKRTGKFTPRRRARNQESKLIADAVVGGSKVLSINVYPFMAAIYQTSESKKAFICGATLISKDTVLTAAHCFLNKESTSKYLVQLGSRHSQVAEEIPEIQEFEVSSVTLHGQFTFPVLYNDIALVKFNGLEKYSASTRPICLADKELDLKAPLNVIILGWGSKQSGGSPTSVLQEAEISVVPTGHCNATLAKLGALTVSFPQGINNKILCAGGFKETKDACQGDSGGPAIVLINNIWRQLGIVSGGIGCGVPGNPGLYTRVSEYITWIDENVK